MSGSQKNTPLDIIITVNRLLSDIFSEYPDVAQYLEKEYSTLTASKK